MSRRLDRQYASRGLIRDGVRGIVLDAGPTVPTNGNGSYAPGCLFIQNDSTGASSIFRNDGTLASCAFNSIFGVDLTGLLATAVEINRASQLSTRVITVAPGGADSTLTVTLAAHDGKTIVLDNATKNLIVNLPAAAAAGTNAKYRFFIGTSITSGAGNSINFVATGAHLFGRAFVISDNSAAVLGYNAAGSTSIVLNGTTTGGIKGDTIEIEDVGSNRLAVKVFTTATGTEATPFG